MHRVLRVLSIVSLTISALAFAGCVYIVTDWNWAPVEVPLPGPGLEVEAPFTITSSGVFRIEARVPASNDSSPVACELEASITSDGAQPQRLVIQQFKLAGAGTLVHYASAPEVRLTADDYVLRVRNLAGAQPFGERGAMLVLTRFAHPTEHFTQRLLLRVVGWCALAIGLLCALPWSRLRRRGRNHLQHQ